MRFRNTFLIGGSTAVALALLLTDPDGGALTALLGMSLVSNLLAVLLAHLSRKALLDYLDLRLTFQRAMESPEGAGRVFQGVAIILAALLLVFSGSVRAEGLRIPSQAEPYLPMLKSEIASHWADHPMPAYFGGLIDHETACPRPSQCWKPTARLKSSREEGGGLGQLTRAWRQDGSLRFDALQEMRAAHPSLSELDWATVYQRPDLQLRAVVLKSRSDWSLMPAGPARLEFTDLAYNAGRGRVTSDRRACQLKAGCDPSLWWGNVETTCTASRTPIYGSRSACDISRHHVSDVLRRSESYKGLL